MAGILWPETDEQKARESLRSARKVLRKVVRTANGEELLEQRSNGEILKLAEQSRLWVDADAFEDLVAQASRTVVPEEALALWQQARVMLRGELLADDQNVEWASHRWVKQRRQVWWMGRCRMIRHLADLYIQRGQIDLAEETLEQHIARFPTDQDALYRLLVLLGQQQCFEQACMLYERTRRALEATGKQPAKHVGAYYEHLRKASDTPHLPELVRNLRHKDGLAPTETTAIEEDAGTAIEVIETSLLLSAVRRPLPEGTIGSLAGLLKQFESAIRSGLGEEQRQNGERLSRRQMISLLMSVVAAAFGLTRTSNVPLLHKEEVLSLCTAHVPLAWQLYFAGGIQEVTQTLPDYLTQLSALAQAPSKHQFAAANLATQAYQLDWLLALQQQNFGKALASIKQAFQYSEIAGDNNLRASSLIREAHIFFHLKRPIQQMQLHQQAMRYSDNLSSLLRGWLYIVLAESHARLRQEREARHFLGLAYDTFPDQPELDPHFSYVPVNHFTLANHTALAYLHLSQPKQAWEALAQVDKILPVTLNPKRVELSSRQAAVSFALGDLEQTCSYFEVAAVSARELGSDLRYNEVCETYEQMQIAWPHESRVKALGELLH